METTFMGASIITGPEGALPYANGASPLGEQSAIMREAIRAAQAEAQAALRQQTLDTLGQEANPDGMAEALTGKNPVVGEMTGAEQRNLVQNGLRTWDGQHNSTAPADLKEKIANNASVSTLVNDVYQQYGAEKLRKLEAADLGEFKFRFAPGNSTAFLGGCIADPQHCSPPPISQPGEAIVISGQNGQHHNVNDHFLTNGFARAIEQRQMGKNTTWIVYSGAGADGYTDAQIAEFRDKANKAGINFQVTDNKQTIADYINEKGGPGDPRSSNPITNLIYTGHGIPGRWEIDYSDVTSHSGIDISQLKAEAFSPTAIVNFNASCNTATGDDSVVNQFQDKLGPGALVSGTVGFTDYGKPPVDTDKELLNRNRSLPFQKRLFAPDAFSQRVITNGMPKP